MPPRRSCRSRAVEKEEVPTKVKDEVGTDEQDSEEKSLSVGKRIGRKRGAPAAVEPKVESEEQPLVKEEPQHDEKPAASKRARGKALAAAVPEPSEGAKFNSVRLLVECWALEVYEAFKKVYPGLQLELNPKAPRKGAFELTAINPDGKETLIWTGIKRGPPRKEKFPEPETLMEALKSAIL